jgi:hypothetical protein
MARRSTGSNRSAMWIMARRNDSTVSQPFGFHGARTQARLISASPVPASARVGAYDARLLLPGAGLRLGALAGACRYGARL